MSETPSPSAVAAWRASADTVLRIAEIAAPKTESEFEGMSLDDVPGVATDVPTDEAIDRVIDAYLADADRVYDEAGSDSTAMPVVFTGIELGQALLAASEDPERAADLLGTDSSGAISLDDSRAVLDVYAEAVRGETPPPSPVELPDDVVKIFEELEVKGTAEVLEIAKDGVLMASLGKAAQQAIALGGDKVKGAFDAVLEKVKWLKRAATKILKWTLDKLRSRLPEPLQKEFDAKVVEIEEWLRGGAKEQLENFLGRVCQRGDATDAWLKAIERGDDLTQPKAKLAEVLAVHLERLGWAGRVRTGAGTVAAVVSGIGAAFGLGLPVNTILAALALLLVGAVGATMWDAYRDSAALVPPPAS